MSTPQTKSTQSAYKKRNRRKHKKYNSTEATPTKKVNNHNQEVFNQLGDELENSIEKLVIMADQSRDEVKAAREAKKLAKQKAKNKAEPVENKPPSQPNKADIPKEEPKPAKSKDEVDRAVALETTKPLQGVVDKDLIKAERAAKKAAKQAKKKGDTPDQKTGEIIKSNEEKPQPDLTVRDVIETLRDIKNVAQQVREMTDRVQALDLDKKPSGKSKEQTPAVQQSKETPDANKSKAELRAERRAKQEAQRAAKEAEAQKKAAAAKPKEVAQLSKEVKTSAVKEKSPKPKTAGKQGSKQQGHKVSWFRHLYNEDIKAKLDNIPINSNLHPAIIKLGVQLATRVVTGSNARCIALLDALKKMVRDYSLPARTEFGRGLEAHLATSLRFLWSMRQPAASQTNAVNFFRHHLTQLPNNVDEFDAKKTLQEEIDRYIREQIDMAGEAISLTVRKKISNGDTILTYGYSSLIERILVEAHAAGVKFRACVCGDMAGPARDMTRRLTARGIHCAAIDITALHSVMYFVDKVVLGASSLLANGSVLAAAGTAAVALTAKANNIPVLVACETHKFTDRVQTDAFVYNEIGDPDDLIIKSDENSPLKDWRSNPNLTPLNLAYDVTPPSLVTAVVTELAILPCTSAPVVLRFKLSEYSI